ncbi:hypothetical protein [Halobacteriovorax sp. HLS]|uniref:Ppx/GppA phosphatase family protein n=1 Tax=Halobacteriovorax sp. HLS TaxID=2234000 RepID=UPI0013E40396|nr:hypothetical protein [Halobacteriovorax sp. HLS]
MIRVSIDIGSNSCLLLIAEVRDGKIETLESQSRVTSLGKKLDLNKTFLQESMDATFEALKEYAQLIKGYNVKLEEVLITATEASRVATNADEFFSKVRRELGLIVTKISGEGEAHYTALGVCSGVHNCSSDIVIMDIGGASTELIRVSLDSGEIVNSISLPVGSVRASDWILDDSFDEKMDKILSSDILSFKMNSIICVAGTMTTLSSILLGQKTFNEQQIQGHKFDLAKLLSLSQELSSLDASQVLEKFPQSGKRAFSLYGGSLVALKILSYLSINEIEISTLGLRYGVVLEGKIDERFTQAR